VTPDVAVSDTNLPDDAFFAQLRETDLLNSFANPTSQAAVTLPPSPPLPPVAAQIPAKPPQNWPAFDPTKPATDFQLQMGIKLVDGVAAPAQ
jgi:carboxyl-terminal processing protease